MIVNKPKPRMFSKQSIQFLKQAIDLVSDKEKDLDLIIENTGIKKKEFWNYHQATLSNSLTLLFLSLENHLKSKICEISPFLLVAGEPQKWGSAKKDIDFNDLFLRSFDDLLTIFLELGLGSISNQTSQSLKKLKDVRNRIVHGVLNKPLTVKDVMGFFHLLVRDIWGPKVWWREFRNHVFDEPLFGLYDSDIEEAHLNYYPIFFEKFLGLKKTGEVFGLNLRQRKYYCPFCYYWLSEDDQEIEPKYSVLVSKKSASSKKLFCPVCDKRYSVTSKRCPDTSCKGNIVATVDGLKTCLTCFRLNP